MTTDGLIVKIARTVKGKSLSLLEDANIRLGRCEVFITSDVLDDVVPATLAGMTALGK